VNSHGLQGSFWPSEEQDLLLRVALAPTEAALAAWEKLRSFDFQDVEVGTFPVLPLVAVRLEQEGVPAPDRARLQGTYRNTWYRNQMHVRRLAGLVRSAARPILLGGLAAAAEYYPSLGLRPVQRTDVLAIGGTLDPDTGASFVLRPTLPVWLYRGADHEVRVRSRGRTISGVSVGALDATDELILAIAQGARTKDPPSIQWLVDAHQIASSGRVDWNELAKRVAASQLVRQVVDTFGYLATVTGRAPDDAVAELATLETSGRERLAARLTGAGAGPAGMLPRHLGDFLRSTADQPLFRAARALPEHLRDAWGLERRSDLPAAALRKAADRARGSRRRSGPETPPGG
jgi:hypothetical protein